MYLAVEAELISHFTTLKSKTSRRDIYLDSDTIAALLAQQERVRLRRNDPEAA
jgi:hypothetical protein